MAGENLPVSTAEAAAPVPSGTTAVEASPAPAPADPTPAQAPAVAETAAPAAEVAPPAEAATTETVVAEATTEAEAAKPEAAKPEGEAEKKAEAAPEKPAEAPTYTDFKIPEGLTVPEERLIEFTGILAENNLTQEAGQKLLDLHAATIKQAQEALATNQRDVYTKMNRDWREDFNRHYGNRANTIADDARFAIREAVKDPKERAAVFAVLSEDMTGAGNNRHVIGMLASLGRKFRERGAPAVAAPARGQPASRADRRYGGNGART